MDQQPPVEKVTLQETTPTQPSSNKTLKYIILFTAFLTFVAFLVGGFVFGSKENFVNKKTCTMEAKVCPDGTSVGRTGPNCEFASCPKVTPTPAFKTYKNDQYGFEFNYPIKGITQKGEEFTEVECGNAIKETKDGILVDNLFKIQIINFPKTIDDYLVQRGAKNTYEFEPILNSSADEAIKVVGIKKGMELVSVGYPPLMYVLYIYKKDDKIFLVVHEAHPPNPTIPEGCINPKDLDHTKFPKFANDTWDVKDSFKFTQKGNTEQ